MEFHEIDKNEYIGDTNIVQYPHRMPLEQLIAIFTPDLSVYRVFFTDVSQKSTGIPV